MQTKDFILSDDGRILIGVRDDQITSAHVPYGVTDIDGMAFRECRCLKEVFLPKTVTTIGMLAFYGCDALESVTIPIGVTEIRDLAFSKCPNLTSAHIPVSVAIMGSGVFSLCPKLHSLTIDKRNTRFDSRDNCNAIIRKSDKALIQGCHNTIIPDGVTVIGDHAFNGCGFTQALRIPDSVRIIGDYAFSNCTGLSSVKLPDRLHKIGEYAFHNTDIEAISLPAILTEIGKNAFEDSTHLQSVDIPANVSMIGDYAFKGCTSLRSITVDEENAFYDSRQDCNAIIEKRRNMLIAGCGDTVIPDGVEEIGSWAFHKCRALTDTSIPMGVIVINTGAFSGSGLRSVTIPASVVHIHDFAFSDCESLSSVTIEGKPVIIDEEMFDNCPALRSIRFLTNDPGNIYLYDDSFNDDNTGRCSLVVPKGAETGYRAHPVFRKFKEIIADKGNE